MGLLETVVVPFDLLHDDHEKNNGDAEEQHRDCAHKSLVFVINILLVLARVLHQTEAPEEERDEGEDQVGVANYGEVVYPAIRLDHVAHNLEFLVVDPLHHALKVSVQFSHQDDEKHELEHQEHAHFKSEVLDVDLGVSGELSQEGRAYVIRSDGSIHKALNCEDISHWIY